MQEFNFGPFTLTPAKAIRVNGVLSLPLAVLLGGVCVGSGVVTGDAPTRADAIEACADSISGFKREARRKHAPETVVLRHFASGVVVASMPVLGGLLPGMSHCIADDRFECWAECGRSRHPMTLQEWTDAATIYAAPENAWIAGLLPDDVLTINSGDWRAPTDMEIRCVVGEHSFTGITGAAAAELCGVAPQNFRKYTAAEGSASRQKISFSMWHLLLHRTGVQKMEVVS